MAKKKKAPLSENGAAQQIVKAFCEEVGIERPASYPKAAGQAQQLANAGVIPGDMARAVQWCREQKWTRDGFDLGTVLSQADKWRVARPKKHRDEDEVVLW